MDLTLLQRVTYVEHFMSLQDDQQNGLSVLGWLFPDTKYTWKTRMDRNDDICLPVYSEEQVFFSSEISEQGSLDWRRRERNFMQYHFICNSRVVANITWQDGYGNQVYAELSLGRDE